MQETLIIADGLATNRILLHAQLAPSSYRVVTVDSASALMAELDRSKPTLIVLSSELSDTAPDALCARLKTRSETRNVPLIVIADGSDPAHRLAMLKAGADEVFARPVQPVMLQARVRSLIRARTTTEELSLRDGTSRALGFSEAQQGFAPAAHVAVMTQDRAVAKTWCEDLAPYMGGNRLSALGYTDIAGDAMRGRLPDVFVIGLQETEAPAGLRLLADLRANPSTRHAGLMVVLAPGTRQSLAADALDLGASDLLAQGFDPRELAQRLAAQIAQKHAQDKLRSSVESELRAAMRDSMTGLYNRRYAFPYLERVIGQTRATGRRFAVMLADLDHFKSVNDRFGHAAGDAVLIEAARRLEDDLRAEDLIARIGGEEFLIILPDTSRDEAEVAAERLCRRINAAPFELPGATTSLNVTISIGVAVGSRDCLRGATEKDNADLVMKLADAALYESKGAGRNQVTLVEAA